MEDAFTRTAFRLSFMNLLVVSLLGLLLRAARVWTVPHLNYTFLLHGHSHFAFSAWAFSALFLLLIRVFLDPANRARKAYRWIFWLTQLAAYGMLFSFPFEGYAAISITFSTLFVAATYWFAWRFYRDTRSPGPQPLPIRLAHAGLLYLLLSSLGPFALGPLVALGYANTPVYFDAVYFYLHFQYNGWFSFAVLALFFRFLETRMLLGDPRLGNRMLRWLVYSCLPTVALSMLWSRPPLWVYVLAWIGAAAQTFALLCFLRYLLGGSPSLLRRLYRQRSAIRAPQRLLWSLALCAFVLKLLMQSVSALPSVAALVAAYRPFVIGYLHLVLLGFVSLFILGSFVDQGILRLEQRRFRVFLYVFVAGILLTELLLFTQAGSDALGHALPGVDRALLLLSIPLPVGLAGLQAALAANR